MGILLYSALLTLAAAVAAPWWLTRMATTGRYREGFRQRLGAVPSGLQKTVAGKRVVWLHAVSVGEVLAASRLVAELGEALGADSIVVISTTTRTGQTLARERFGADRVFYMPLDFAFAVRAYIHTLKPAALILMESELWPRLLHECARRNVPVAVVNARVSDRSFARAMRVRGLWRWAFSSVRLWLAQSAEDAFRLRRLGANVVRETGNLKYDVRAPRQSDVANLIREVAAGRPLIVAGSTTGSSSSHEDTEEEIAVEAWQGLTQREGEGILLVVAPRHPERFQFVASIVNTSYADASKLEGLRSPAGFAMKYDIVVLDTIGDLAAVYGIADIAFVGGSLVPRGGHNPLEPAQFGVPVIMGRSYENFRSIVNTMREADAIRIVNDKKELEAAFADLLTNREAARAMGERGRAVFESQQGATARTVEALVQMIGGTR